MAFASAYVDKILDQEGYIRIEDIIAMRTANLTENHEDGNHIDAKKKRHREDDDFDKSAKRVKFTTTTIYSFPIELGESSTAAFSPLGMGQRHLDEELFDLSTISERDPSHSKKEVPPSVTPPKYDPIPREERLARLRAAGVSDADIHAHEQVARDIARKQSIEKDKMQEMKWCRALKKKFHRASSRWHGKGHVDFVAAAVYTFDIDLGGSAISSDGGLPLGMSSTHSKLEIFDLTRTIPTEQQRVQIVSPQERECRLDSADIDPARTTEYKDEAAAIDHSRYIDKVKRFKDNTLDLLERQSELDQRRSCGPYEPNHDGQEKKRRAPDDAEPTNAQVLSAFEPFSRRICNKFCNTSFIPVFAEIRSSSRSCNALQVVQDAVKVETEWQKR
ncbi:hypothetical protein AC1031_001623 [Aphanomyces cochlioides]|nr:hypothetical protein AC1031_001623 [Aphanomyces cochlioides]